MRWLAIALLAVFLMTQPNLAAADLGGSESLDAVGIIIYVNDDAPGLNNGTTWHDAFTDLQSALAFAGPGIEIWVAAGIYKPTPGLDRSATFQLATGVEIYGGFAGTEANRNERNWTVNISELSGDLGVPGPPMFGGGNDDSYHVVTGIGVDATAVLDGFKISRGAADDGPVPWEGAGVLLDGASPTLANLNITECYATNGAGMAIRAGGHPTIFSSEFSRNEVTQLGGGIYCRDSSPIFEGLVVFWNYSSYVGGGLYILNGSATLTDVQFLNNSAADAAGGMRSVGCIASLTRVSFVGNEVWDLGLGAYGGGYLAAGDVTLLDVEFIDNISVSEGGGMHATGDPSLTNVVFRSNQGHDRGGGLYLGAGSATLTNVSFEGNGGGWQGGGIYLDGATPSLFNTILWGNMVYGSGPQIYNSGGNAFIAHSLIQGSGGSGGGWDAGLGTDGGNNLDADPLFVDAAAGNLQLTALSPAINMGDQSLLPAGVTTDLAGDPRVSGPEIDMGAYEFQGAPCETFQVSFGSSWDGISLQQVFDNEFGAGVIDAATDYEGYRCGDAVVPYWIDENVDGWIIREIANNLNLNVFGWYAEDFAMPVIDGVDDGVIFDGSAGSGDTQYVGFPVPTRFGFYLDPRGPQDGQNAPQPEVFFTNRYYNDIGASGGGPVHPPDGGDPQALIYNITELRGGIPSYVIAWEDLDSGAEITPGVTTYGTDNDYNDFVVEIRAASPVSAVVSQLAAVATEDGVSLHWDVEGGGAPTKLQIFRSEGGAAESRVATLNSPALHGEWLDDSLLRAGSYLYRILVEFQNGAVSSEPVAVKYQPATPTRSVLLGATPNPFNPQTRIEFALAASGPVSLKVYDTAGRLVRDLSPGVMAAGPGFVDWDGSDDAGRRVSSGVYLVQLVAGSQSDRLRVLLLK